jgi:hypothetical protein
MSTFLITLAALIIVLSAVFLILLVVNFLLKNIKKQIFILGELIK